MPTHTDQPWEQDRRRQEYWRAQARLRRSKTRALVFIGALYAVLLAFALLALSAAVGAN